MNDTFLPKRMFWKNEVQSMLMRMLRNVSCSQLASSRPAIDIFPKTIIQSAIKVQLRALVLELNIAKVFRIS